VEPGTGPDDVSGYWLTLYRLSEGKLVQDAQTFHASPCQPTTGTLHAVQGTGQGTGQSIAYFVSSGTPRWSP